MKILSFIMLLTVFLAQDCKNRTNKESLPELETTEVMPVIKIVKNPCFGKCPTYAMTIQNDGKVEFVGRANVDKLGTFVKQLSTDQVALLIGRLNAAKFWEMEDKYLSGLADTPRVIISQLRKDSSKTVTGDHARPESLKLIQKTLDKIAESKEGWKKTKDPLFDDKGNMPKHYIKNEIIAKFEKGADVEAALLTKKQFGIKVKKRVAPNVDMWVLTYDTTRVNPELMILQVKKMPGVVGAEFNKRLAPRDH